MALACAGPLALPLIWFHPGLKTQWKWLLSLAILVLSTLLIMATIHSVEVLIESYGEILDMLDGY